MYETEEQRLAYTAGFIEADGCFHTQNSVSLRITNKYVPILLLFKSWWGGNVRSKGQPLNCYDWNLHSSKAEELTIRLLPYLNMKKREAELLIEYQQTIGGRGTRVSEDLLLKRENIKNEIKHERSKRNNYFVLKEELVDG